MLLHIGILHIPFRLLIIILRIRILLNLLSFVFIQFPGSIGIALASADILFLAHSAAANLSGSAMGSPAILIDIRNAEVIIFITRSVMDISAIANSLDRESVHMPVHHVQFVDKLLHIMISRQPAKTLPVAHHIFHIAPPVFALYPPDRAAVTKEVGTYDISNSTLGHSTLRFYKIFLIPADGTAYDA